MPGMRVAAMRGNSMEDSKAKLQRAENSMLFAKKMVAAIENTELRTRMKALTSNQALTSTFIFGTAASCMFNTDSLTPDLGDSEYDAKMVVKSLFFCLSAVSALLLLLNVSILKIQFSLFVLTPDHCVDDLLLELWFAWLPEVLITVAASLLCALLPLYAFFHFGTSLEFYLVLVVTILCGITSFVYWMLAKRLLHHLYKDCLGIQAEHIENQHRGVHQGSTKYCSHRDPDASPFKAPRRIGGAGAGSEPAVGADAGHAPG